MIFGVNLNIKALGSRLIIMIHNNGNINRETTNMSESLKHKRQYLIQKHPSAYINSYPDYLNDDQNFCFKDMIGYRF